MFTKHKATPKCTTHTHNHAKHMHNNKRIIHMENFQNLFSLITRSIVPSAVALMDRKNTSTGHFPLLPLFTVFLEAMTGWPEVVLDSSVSYKRWRDVFVFCLHSP